MLVEIPGLGGRDWRERRIERLRTGCGDRSARRDQTQYDTDDTAQRSCARRQRFAEAVRDSRKPFRQYRKFDVHWFYIPSKLSKPARPVARETKTVRLNCQSSPRLDGELSH